MSAYKRFTFNDETEGPPGPPGPTGPQGPSGNFVGKIKDWQSEFVPIQLPGQPLFRIIEDGDDIYLGLAGPGVGRNVGGTRGSIQIFDERKFDGGIFDASYGFPMDPSGAPPELIIKQQWIIAYDVSSNRRGFIPIFYPEPAELQLKIGTLNILNGGLINTTNFTAGTTNFTAGTYNSDPDPDEHHFEFNLSNTLILENSGNFVPPNSFEYTLESGSTNTSTNLVYNDNWDIISPSSGVNNMHYVENTHIIKLYKTGISNVVYTKFVIPYKYTLPGRSLETTNFVFYVQWT